VIVDLHDAPPTPWLGVLEHSAAVVTEPLGLALVGTAAGGTALASASGADHEARRAAIEGFGSEAYGDVMVIAGYVAPVAIPAGLYAVGLGARKRALAHHGAAAIQAVVVTFGATLALKVITGRPFPLHGGDPAARDRLAHPEYAREWNPLQPARGYAWPSGHASAAFAAAAALSASTADLTVTATSYGVATAISVGMLVGDHHWLSDVVAGALIGQAVGDAVGRGFRARLVTRDASTSWRIVPHASFGGATAIGLSIVGTGGP
jgi:membrane-associated phospholipid phosphatase